MAKPNKTVGEWLRKNPRQRDAAEVAQAARNRNPDMFDIMDRVQSGEMTAEEGVAAIKAMTERK